MKNNKKGSSTILLSMIFVAFVFMIISSIAISRRMVLKSQVKSFGKVWSKAVLSEYDIHLFQDYGLLAFKGNDGEISDKINRYVDFSFDGRMKSSLEKSGVCLFGYEMRDPKNFKNSMKNGIKEKAISSIIKDEHRIGREEKDISSEDIRKIGNPVVLETLPSKGSGGAPDISGIANILKQDNKIERLKNEGVNTAVELAFIYKYFDSHLKRAEEKKSFFRNEWEYIISGKPNDEENYRICRRKIFFIRNALNLIYLKSDSEKMALISAAAELITPGPLSAGTKILLMEMWAAAEAEYDVDTLVKGGKIPILKTRDTWGTDLGTILDGDKLKKSLSKEEIENLNKNKKSLIEKEAGKGGKNEGSGYGYEDYLFVLMLSLNQNTRVLRTMDIVQINMKYRYYEDFNFEEYYTGLCFSIKMNGHEYEIKDRYK